MNNQQYQCAKFKKVLANRHSLSRHKKTCQNFRGRKRASDDDDGTEIVSKNPKIQALNDVQVLDTMFYSNQHKWYFHHSISISGITFI